MKGLAGKWVYELVCQDENCFALAVHPSSCYADQAVGSAAASCIIGSPGSPAGNSPVPPGSPGKPGSPAIPGSRGKPRKPWRSARADATARDAAG